MTTVIKRISSDIKIFGPLDIFITGFPTYVSVCIYIYSVRYFCSPLQLNVISPPPQPSRNRWKLYQFSKRCVF
jgi:hypothetical protein